MAFAPLPDIDHVVSSTIYATEEDVPGYERLREVLLAAYAQAATGKGAIRHGQDLPFHEQPMQQISTLLQSVDGMAFQAIKKIREGLHMTNKAAAIAELLGAINYVAGIVIYLQDEEEVE